MSNFEKQVELLCLIAKQSTKKAKIMFEKIAQLQPAQNKKRISVFQLQSLKHKNCIKDHSVLVDKIKEEFGSLRKAAKAYNLYWRTFNMLCQPPVPKKKAT